MKKVLVVDDSPAWRGFHKKFLEEVFIELDSADYSIDYAISARDGYDYLMKNNEVPCDLIITDLQMEDEFYPKLAGEWFTEQIKTFSKYVNTKIMICSGCGNIKHIAEGFNVDYLPKRTAVSDINAYKDLVISLLK